MSLFNRYRCFTPLMRRLADVKNNLGKGMASRRIGRGMGYIAQAMQTACSVLGIALWNLATRTLYASSCDLVGLNGMSCPSPLQSFLPSKPGQSRTFPIKLSAKLHGLLRTLPSKTNGIGLNSCSQNNLSLHRWNIFVG